jgi:hypothetical protein
MPFPIGKPYLIIDAHLLYCQGSNVMRNVQIECMSGEQQHLRLHIPDGCILPATVYRAFVPFSSRTMPTQQGICPRRLHPDKDVSIQDVNSGAMTYSIPKVSPSWTAASLTAGVTVSP